MMNKRTAIGIGVGSVIIAIGLYSLVSSFGLQTVKVDETFGVGESTSYQFTAPIHAKQFLNVTGNSFNLSLVSPRGGLQVPEQGYKNNLSLEWVHLEDGKSHVVIKNTGDSELRISGTLQFLTDPIQITYHIVVITAGIIIIGFSAGFSIRKPRGF
jgi:hypothetical protein